MKVKPEALMRMGPTLGGVIAMKVKGWRRQVLVSLHTGGGRASHYSHPGNSRGFLVTVTWCYRPSSGYRAKENEASITEKVSLSFSIEVLFIVAKRGKRQNSVSLTDAWTKIVVYVCSGIQCRPEKMVILLPTKPFKNLKNINSVKWTRHKNMNSYAKS